MLSFDAGRCSSKDRGSRRGRRSRRSLGVHTCLSCDTHLHQNGFAPPLSELNYVVKYCVVMI